MTIFWLDATVLMTVRIPISKLIYKRRGGRLDTFVFRTLESQPLYKRVPKFSFGMMVVNGI